MNKDRSFDVKSKKRHKKLKHMSRFWLFFLWALSGALVACAIIGGAVFIYSKVNPFDYKYRVAVIKASTKAEKSNVYAQKAQELLDDGKTDEALAETKKASNTYNTYEAQKVAAEIYYQEEDYSACLSAFQAALAAAKSDPSLTQSEQRGAIFYSSMRIYELKEEYNL